MACCVKHNLEQSVIDAALHVACVPKGEPKLARFTLQVLDRAVEDLLKIKTPEEISAIQESLAFYKPLLED